MVSTRGRYALRVMLDAVHIDIRVSAALQRTVAPILDVDGGFLVQLADGSGRNLAAPQRLRDVLHPAHGNACQIHLDEGLLYAALPAAVALDDGSLEGHALESGYMERDVAGGRGEVVVIMAAAVALTDLAALVASGLCQGTPPLFPAVRSGFPPRCFGPIP